MRNNYFLLFIFTILVGCGPKALPPVVFNVPARTIDYLSEVKPLLDKRCVVCHSCYNSPCQLKLSSYEGLDRGATKLKVYDATRLTTMDPTRLFTDAKTTAEWRQQGFTSVTENTAPPGQNNSIMLQLLDHKMQNPQSIGNYQAEATDLDCSASRIELGSYLSEHPNNGMPFGFPALTRDEFNIIAGWLTQGAHGPTTTEQEALISPSPDNIKEIAKWESFFNNSDPKYVMTARYLFEHLFLAHIHFGDQEYYELVRSTTPPGQEIVIINSIRPYDSPETQQFYYRFRKIHSTIVHKTHMVFDLNDQVMARFSELFLEPEWLTEPHIMDYNHKVSANPFITFAQIPPLSRYQFLLDNNQYIITTFIRGPVCKGQVALNVIHDHFWIIFLDPENDLSVQYPGLLKFQRLNLRMPIEKGSSFGLVNIIWNRYEDAAVNYYRYRQNFYMSHNYNGMDYDAIWPGNKASDAPLITVFRHFDSASSHKGALGNIPRTAWVLDYPIFERIYYALVAGFDVYGNVGHQIMVRNYMDLLRVEAESNFIEFLPQTERRAIMQNWNLNTNLSDINYYISEMPAKIPFFSTNQPREFLENIITNHFRPECQITFDPINYIAQGQDQQTTPEHYLTSADYLKGLQASSESSPAILKVFAHHEVNQAFIRIKVDENNDKNDVVISGLIDRWHDNVTTMLSEEDNLNPDRDKITFIPGFVGSYPNLFFVLSQKEFPAFLDLLVNYKANDKYNTRLNKYMVNRADKDFWDHYDWFQKRFFHDQPIKAGLFDLNRYSSKTNSDEKYDKR